MKRTYWMLFLALSLVSAKAQLQVSTAPSTGEREYEPASPPSQNAIVTVTDNLHYFFNKHYYKNTTLANSNTQFYTLKSPYPNNALTHAGSVFLNTGTVTVTGLEGLVMKNPSSPSASVALRLYFFDMGTATMPTLPATDSIITSVSNSTAGVWAGGNFATPHVVTGNFAVMFQFLPGPNSNVGDTVRLFLNNAYAQTSTITGVPKFGEGLSFYRWYGTMTSNTGAFGPGTDYEWVVAPRVSFVMHADAAVTTPTICKYSQGTFTNTSIQQKVLENRQFNFDKFAAYWAPTNTLIPNTDSIYNWQLSSATPPVTFVRDAVGTFNSSGNQTASLTISYWKSINGGTQPGPVYDGTAVTIYVDGSSSPQISVTGNTNICAGQTTTLSVTGNPTYTWTSPSSNQSSIVVTPASTTVYTVQAANGGCTARETITVQVSSPSSVSITNVSAACQGSNYFLTASGASSYTWSTGGHNTTLSQNSNTTGVISYTLYGTNGACPTSSAVASVTVYAKPSLTLTATRTLLCTKGSGGKNVNMTGLPSGGTFSGNNVSGPLYVVPSNPATTTVVYSYTDQASGCTNSSTLTMKVSDCTGLDENQEVLIEVFPNPTQDGRINLRGLNGFTQLTVVNLVGQNVLIRELKSDEIQIDLSDFPSGPYFMRMQGGGRNTATVRVVNLH